MSEHNRKNEHLLSDRATCKYSSIWVVMLQWLLPRGPCSPREPREMRKCLKSNGLQVMERGHAKQSTSEGQETVGPEKGM